jgi:hypothetical protein
LALRGEAGLTRVRGNLAVEGLREALDSELARAGLAMTAAMEETGRELIEALRDLTFGAGLGSRLPYAWKLRSYPQSGASLEPSAYVYSAAAAIISFFSPP